MNFATSLNHKFMPQVTFFQVKTPQEKLSKISSIAEECLYLGHHLLILVENEKAESFLDDMLWNMPKESFIPHAVSHKNLDDPIVISTFFQAHEHRHIVLNLTSAPLIGKGNFTKIFQLEDLTSVEKKNLSISFYKAYQDAGYPIISR